MREVKKALDWQMSKVCGCLISHEHNDHAKFLSEMTKMGTANYVKHTGSRPMNITWQLDRPIPAKFLKKTNKLVVG